MTARRTRLSGLEIVFALQMATKEGHRSYRAQSDNPGKGTTLGGETDDPRREHTRDAAAGDPPRGRTQRERRVPGGRDLADAVLSVAEPARAVRRGWLAPATASRPARTAVAAHTRRGTS